MNFIDEETPQGPIDGNNQVFTLVVAPRPSLSLNVYVNGNRANVKKDYGLHGNTITFYYPLPTGTDLVACYRY